MKRSHGRRMKRIEETEEAKNFITVLGCGCHLVTIFLMLLGTLVVAAIYYFTH